MTELNGYINRQGYITDICNKIEYKEQLSKSEENFVFSNITNLKDLLRHNIDKETQLNIRRNIAVFETYIYSSPSVYERYKSSDYSTTEEIQPIIQLSKEPLNTEEKSADKDTETRLAEIRAEVEQQYSNTSVVSDKAKATVAYLKRVFVPNTLVIFSFGAFAAILTLAGLKFIIYLYIILLAFMALSGIVDLLYIRNLHFRQVIDELKLEGLVNTEAIAAIVEIESDNRNRSEELMPYLLDKF